MKIAAALLIAAAALAAPMTASAGSLDNTAADSAVSYPTPAARTPGLMFTLRGGVAAGPAYFGSKKTVAGPDLGFSLDYLRLPGGYSLGDPDPYAVKLGFAPFASLNFIAKRSAVDYPELTGLPDVKAAFELGAGIGYTHQNFEAFVAARYGVIGHESWVGEAAVNMVARPNDALTLRAGPRVFFADSDYANTYFGTPSYTAKGGILSTSFDVGATYELNDVWALDGAIRYEQYQNDAKNSPIVQQGKDSNVSLRLGVSRRFSF
jgi:outer membrane scaffolding protein for murein synthesis (MipA/OmpV family)